MTAGQRGELNTGNIARNTYFADGGGYLGRWSDLIFAVEFGYPLVVGA